MKKIYLLITFLVGMFLVPTTATAVTVAELNKMDPITAAQVLRQLGGSGKTTASVEKADEWVTLAERLGKALASLAKEAGVALNEFVKTPVGIITVTVLLWKTVGVSMVAGLIWVVSLCVIIWSFRAFHVPIKAVGVVRDADNNPIVEDGKVKEKTEYIKRFQFTSDDARAGSAWAHGALFIIINAMLIVAIAVS